MTLALEATGLGKRYGRTWGLRDCSLSIPAGHVAALVGPNGAGKTTLLKLAVGLLRPSAGAIRTFGETPARTSPRSGGSGSSDRTRRSTPTSRSPSC